MMKQKFATLKKTIESKENCEGVGGKRVVIVRGGGGGKEQRQ